MHRWQVEYCWLIGLAKQLAERVQQVSGEIAAGVASDEAFAKTPQNPPLLLILSLNSRSSLQQPLQLFFEHTSRIDCGNVALPINQESFWNARHAVE